MPYYPRIKVINPTDHLMPTECYIDDKKMTGVISLDFSVSVSEVPTCRFETVGLPNIDMLAIPVFEFTPRTVNEAATVLQKEFQTNSKSYTALVDSIASVLKEMPAGTGLYIVAESVANRIIGIEK